MHNSSVKCSRVIYFFPDVGLPGVWRRNIFSSNNPNDSQIACLSLVKNLLMMRVEGAPCLLVADDSPVYEEKQREKNNHVSPKSFLLMKPNDTRASKQTSPSLRISRISFLLLFWSVKSTFITITIKFPFSNSICAYAQTGISIGKKLDMIGTWVEAQGSSCCYCINVTRNCSIPVHTFQVPPPSPFIL